MSPIDASASQTVIDSQVTVQHLSDGQAAGVVIEHMIVNGSVIINGWKLFVGDSRLSKTRDVAEAIKDTQTIKDTLEKLGNTEAFPGPVLLGVLLQNYQRRHQESFDAAQVIGENLKCFNQDSVRRRINQLSSVRLIELSGPSGIGKSHILQAICCNEDERQLRGIPPHEWDLWKTVCVDAQNRSMSFDAIMDAFTAALTPEAQQQDAAKPDLRGLLMQSIIKGKHHFLFVLDGADQIAPEVLVQLGGDDGPIGRNTRAALSLLGVGTLRLVIASRRPRVSERIAHDKQLQVSLQTIQMDPLDLESIRSMLTERIQTQIMRTMRLQDEVIDQMADHIFQMSGGHPRAVEAILRLLEQRNFAVPLVDFHRLFQQVVLSIVEQDVIGDLSLKEYLLLNVLSIFRRFHVHIIEYLLTHGLLPGDLLGGNASANEMALRTWLDRLCETPALIRRSPNEPSVFVVHPVLRHVLPMDLANTTPLILCQLHLIAYELYDQGLRERDASKIRLLMPLPTRPVYTMEALYHYVQSELICPAGTTVPRHAPRSITDLAREYLHLYQEAYHEEQGVFARDPLALLDQWKYDKELRQTMARLPDGNRMIEDIDHLFRAGV